jgi:predicted outer membrane repeat protein
MVDERIRIRRIVPLCAIILAILTCTSRAEIIYVDDDANGPGDGSSWQTAYKYLQDALAVARAGDEVRLAQGTYRPDRSAANPEGSRDRTAAFQMLSGVALVGGFAGVGSPDPNGRDVQIYETILSGDLAGNDVLSEDPCDFVPVPNEGTWIRPDRWCLLIESTRRENSLHVLTYSGTDQAATLDGFTITAGNAFLPPYWWGSVIATQAKDWGGGLFHDRGALTVKACRFLSNSSVGRAASICNQASPQLLVKDCLFFENLSQWGTGGMFCEAVSNVTLTNCTFEKNTSLEWHSAIICEECALDAIDCKFMYNLSGSPDAAVSIRGGTARMNCSVFVGNEWGAVDLRYSDVLLTGCEFRQNAGFSGAAIHARGGRTDVLRCAFSSNCVRSRGGSIDSRIGKLLIEQSLFSGNSAGEQGGALYTSQNETIISNCTFANNRASLDGGAIATYCEDSTKLVDSILRRNSSPRGPATFVGEYLDGSHPSTVAVSYCLLERGQSDVALDSHCTLVWGEGNIAGDPCFAMPGFWDPNGMADDPNDDFWVEGDYHLKSQAGRWDPNSQNWVMDDVTSPCIDAGDPNSPVEDEPVPNGARVNMGAYGGTAEASKSPTTRRRWSESGVWPRRRPAIGA